MKRIKQRRRSYRRLKKMKSHLEELKSFIFQRFASFETMIDAELKHEMKTHRKKDRK